MAQSTLALSRDDLRSMVGHYLGYGADSAGWSTAELDEITRIVASGLRRFYEPPIVDGTAHRWSFLAPTYTFNTAADDYDYDMPDDYGEVNGPIHYDNSENANCPVELVSPERILMLRNLTLDTGTPRYAAIRPKAQVAGSHQLWEMLFHPIPNAVLTVHFAYFRLVDALSSTNTYPYGGAAHSETIKAACMAEAALYKDDETSNWEARFLERLTVSVAKDRRAHEADTLGYNGRRVWRNGINNEVQPSYPANISIGGVSV